MIDHLPLTMAAKSDGLAVPCPPNTDPGALALSVVLPADPAAAEAAAGPAPARTDKAEGGAHGAHGAGPAGCCGCCAPRSGLPPSPVPYSAADLAWGLCGLLTLLLDAGTDAWLSAEYLASRQYWWFGLTLFFALAPSLVVQAFSLRWFAQDFRLGATGSATAATAGRCGAPPPPPPLTTASASAGTASAGERCYRGLVWVFQSVVHLLQLGLAWRYVSVAYLGVRSRGEAPCRRRLRWALLYATADASMLRLLLAFLQSAPQLVLQLCVMVQRSRATLVPGVCVCSSLASLAWSVAAYHKTLRDSRDDKLPLGYRAAAAVALWHLLTAASRALAFALFASVFQLYFGVFLVLHWCLVTFWVVHAGTEFCASKWEEILCDLVAGVAGTFCWVSVKGGPSRCRLAAFHALALAENAALALLWWFYRDRRLTDAYAAPALALVFGSFAAGLGFMLAYYGCLHPSRPCAAGRAGDAGEKGKCAAAADDGGVAEPARTNCCLCCRDSGGGGAGARPGSSASPVPANGSAVGAPNPRAAPQTPQSNASARAGTGATTTPVLTRAGGAPPAVGPAGPTLLVLLDTCGSAGPIFQVRAASRPPSAYWPVLHGASGVGVGVGAGGGVSVSGVGGGGSPHTPSRRAGHGGGRGPSRSGPVIRIDMPRRRYPAWDAHVVDRRLRRSIRVLERATPGVVAVRYQGDAAAYELAEYETTV
uniref:XK-related protein n=1 Tax=Petromyzon marinus TaxID=7757 RepID=A0AAJ7UHR9_PETMA|nr:XK-related protein 6-like [Petromyzon marinus]